MLFATPLFVIPSSNMDKCCNIRHTVVFLLILEGVVLHIARLETLVAFKTRCKQGGGNCTF